MERERNAAPVGFKRVKDERVVRVKVQGVRVTEYGPNVPQGRPPIEFDEVE